ncbi:MAG: preprotein translocase subunit SecG [Verrucomicrobia bacterium]|nr:preprotein translocase subunit SecG [Verrucomicrobiota bacterium]MBS0646082.1 preprotein translocase subunit SecG [Verrucomicrobiota bacterium]
MTILYYLFLFLFLFTSVILCFVILIQESKSSGLGASFGGDSGDSLFGTSTPVILKKITAWLAAIFLVSCVLLSIWTGAMGRINAKRPSISTEVIES